MAPLIGSNSSISSSVEIAQTFQLALLSRFLPQDDIPISTPNVDSADLPWPPITEEEIFRACCQISSTTPGPDKITLSSQRRAWPIIGSRASNLFRQCIRSGINSIAFMKPTVIILPKSGNWDLAPPKSYRPIALLLCLGKGLERLIARRISFIALQHRELTEDQCSVDHLRSAADI